jgi:hypothetical protein
MIRHNQTSNSKFNGLVEDINSMEYYLDIKPKGQYLAQTIDIIFLKPTIMGNTKE